ncbi:unnamed protein product [Ixodes pacificus]
MHRLLRISIVRGESWRQHAMHANGAVPGRGMRRMSRNQSRLGKERSSALKR